jgi:hypothetical protein
VNRRSWVRSMSENRSAACTQRPELSSPLASFMRSTASTPRRRCCRRLPLLDAKAPGFGPGLGNYSSSGLRTDFIMMEAITTTLAFLRLISLLVFPQLLGVLLFLRLRSLHHLMAHLLGFLLPTISYIGLCWMVFIYGYYRAHPDDHCGGQLLGALGVISVGSAIHILCGLMVQGMTHGRSHTCAGNVRNRAERS